MKKVFFLFSSFFFLLFTDRERESAQPNWEEIMIAEVNTTFVSPLYTTIRNYKMYNESYV